jgi:hypothetical protein
MKALTMQAKSTKNKYITPIQCTHTYTQGVSDVCVIICGKEKRPYIRESYVSLTQTYFAYFTKHLTTPP